MEIAFQLSDKDLEHFREVMHRARESASEMSRTEIIDHASELMIKVNQSGASDFIREGMNQIETLIGMVCDEGWGLEEEDRSRVMEAQIQAYRDFVVYRAAETARRGEDAMSLDRADWLEERRKQLQARMRRRRRRMSTSGGNKSSYSLF
jgi:hypothetical protein